MKKYIATTIAAAGLIVFAFGINSSAQSVGRMVAYIPFDFYVGEERLPSGSYEFQATNRNANPGAVVVRGLLKSERRSLIIPTMAETAKPGSGTLLLFNRYGSEHFLSRISLSTDDVSFRVRRTSSEARLARENQRAVPVTVRQAVAAAR